MKINVVTSSAEQFKIDVKTDEQDIVCFHSFLVSSKSCVLFSLTPLCLINCVKDIVTKSYFYYEIRAFYA